MITEMIVRTALTSTQKSIATIAAKTVTTAVSTVAGIGVQNSFAKKESERLAAKENLTEEEVKKAQLNVALKGGICSGLLAGAGLVAFYKINEIIQKS